MIARARGAPVAELLGELRDAGLPISVDDHVRVGRLLACDGQWTHDRLRLSLRALIAKDVEQQAIFDAAFTRLYGRDADAPPPSLESVVQVLPRERPRRIAPSIALAATAAAILAAVAAWLGRDPGPQPRVAPAIATTVPDAGVELDASTEPDAQGATAAAPPPLLPTEATAETTAGDAAPAVTGATQSDVDSQRALVGGVARALVALGATCLLMALALVWRSRRRQRRFVRGPWTWQPTVPDGERTAAFDESAIEDAAAALTLQATGESEEIDVERTARATAEAAGYPAIVRKARPPAPQYAVLIDRSQSSRGWRGLFEEATARLRRAGVHADVYEFDGDPDTCSRPGGRGPIELRSLVDHVDALIVVGDAAGAFDPVARERSRWIDTLRSFPRRLWLNPLPRSRWSSTVRSLAETTPMAHAILGALGTLWLPGEPRDAAREHPLPPAALLEPASDVAVDALRRHLGDAFRLLQLCAVAGPPDPELALWLAARFRLAIGEPERLRLLALPCFAEGAWARGERERLVESLRAEAPALEADARRAFLELSARTEPIAGSVAHLRWRSATAAHHRALGESAAVGDLLDSPIGDVARADLAAAGFKPHVRPASFVLGAGGTACLLVGFVLAGSLALVPADDVSRLAVSLRDNTGTSFQLVEAELRIDGRAVSLAQAIERVTVQHGGASESITRVAFSPDGQSVATAAYGQEPVRLWNTVTGAARELPVRAALAGC